MNAIVSSPAFRNYALPFLLIVALLAGWEYAKPSRPAAAPKPAADHGPPPPRNADEEMIKLHRVYLKRSTLQYIDKDWASFCQPEGRRMMVSTLREYFYYRDGSETSYPLRWGDVGKQYIMREWSTTDDKRIEQLIKDLYYRGYLDLKAFDNPSQKRMTALVKGLAVNNSKPCAA